MSFLTGTLEMSKAYWLVAVFGSLGGVIRSILHNENKLVLCSTENFAKIRLGFVGDMVLGLAGASAVIFLFGGTLRFDPNNPDSYVLLISVSLIAGVYARNVIETAGEKLLQQMRQTAKEETKQLQPAVAVAYTYEARETINKGMSLRKALQLTELALQHDANYVNAYIEKGRALKRLGEIDKALTAVEEVLRIEPDNAKALYNRACYKCLLRKSNGEILSDLRKAFESFPKLKEFAREDPDLQGIRKLPEFKRLVEGNPLEFR